MDQHCDCCLAFKDDAAYVKDLQTRIKSLEADVIRWGKSSDAYQDQITALKTTQGELKALVSNVHMRLLQAGIMLDGLDLSLLLRIS